MRKLHSPCRPNKLIIVLDRVLNSPLLSRISKTQRAHPSSKLQWAPLGQTTRQGPGIFPRLLLEENRRKIEPKETPSCLIPRPRVVFTSNLKSQWQSWARLHRKAIFSHLAVTNIRIVPTIGEQDVSQLRSLVKYQQRQQHCKCNRFYIIVHVRWTDTIVRASVVQNRNVLDSDWCFKKWCLPVTVRRENRRRHGHIAIRTVIDAKYYNISLRCFVQVLQI